MFPFDSPLNIRKPGLALLEKYLGYSLLKKSLADMILSNMFC